MAQTPSEITARPHAAGADLPLLIEFASRTLRERFPLDALWHPGDVVWELKTAGEAGLNMRLWEDGSGLVAIALFDGPGHLWFEHLPGREHLLPDIVAWAEWSLGGGSLSVKLAPTDESRVRAVEALGYRRGADEGVRFRRSLDQEIAPAPLPDGIRLRDCIGVDPEARAACHRDAWNRLEHLGIDARSSFTADTYRRLLASPVYDPSLDILAETADGRLVANCICWTDAESGIGTFEPVGTHVAFRGQGLARAVNVEGLRRLKARGMGWGRVSTAHFNAPAIATYLSCGFEIIDRPSWWTKPPA